MANASHARRPAKRRPRPIEDREQAALFCWVAYESKKRPVLALLHAIPNGGKRTAITASLLKLQGVRAGVPDLDLPVARMRSNHAEFGHAFDRPYYGLRIELKRPIVKGEERPKVSPEQKRWLTDLQEQGHCCCVCYGWHQARESIEAYLACKPVPHQWAPA
jgi:hypothetical protein